MAPLALVQMTVFAFALGEAGHLNSNWSTIKGSTLWIVALTGVGSFSLNLCSLKANQVTSPLTLSIMANVKQVRASDLLHTVYLCVSCLPCLRTSQALGVGHHCHRCPQVQWTSVASSHQGLALRGIS